MNQRIPDTAIVGKNSVVRIRPSYPTPNHPRGATLLNSFAAIPPAHPNHAPTLVANCPCCHKQLKLIRHGDTFSIEER